jgi:hypothetical protein
LKPERALAYGSPLITGSATCSRQVKSVGFNWAPAEADHLRSAVWSPSVVRVVAGGRCRPRSSGATSCARTPWSGPARNQPHSRSPGQKPTLNHQWVQLAVTLTSEFR